jgi:large subunit ribosomal protein L6
MSRIGKNPITIPQGVDAAFDGNVLKVKGPKGELGRVITKDVKVTVADGVITFVPVEGSDAARALWGTFAAHAHNMIEGVTVGFKKELEIEGVGYRAEAQGNKLKLNVGFSHPVELVAPEGITIKTEKSLITVEGCDKDAVGQFAADIRAVKKPEPYKGKGIHYVGEYIIRKQGKKAVT